MKTFVAYVNWAGGAAKISVEADSEERARVLALEAFRHKPGAYIMSIFAPAF